jgi:cytochrome c oxidase cbb3-type subunit III
VLIWKLSGITLLSAGLLCAQHEKDGEKAKHPFIGDEARIEAGRKLFASGCGACHGAEGQGGRGPNLRERVFWHPLEDQTLYDAIQKGIGGSMPAANLPPDRAWEVVAFVRSLTAPAAEGKVPGDVKKGEALFRTHGCNGCHQVNGQGGQLGPDLSNSGAMRSLPQLREAILDPDADGAFGYRAVTAVLNNGRTLTGVARNRTNYSLQLQDAQGKLHLLNVGDIRELTLSKGSPMPKDYARKLSKQEIDHLISFLGRQTLRPQLAQK